MRRRSFLASGVAATSSLVLACGRREPSQALTGGAAVRMRALRDTLVTSPREELIGRLVRDLRNGLDPRELLGALHLAGTQWVSTREQFGKDHHILLCARSTFELGGVSSDGFDWRPLLWSCDFFKDVQSRRTTSVEDMAPTTMVSSKWAQREFGEAIEAFDGDRAAAAITSLFRSGPRSTVRDLLLRYGSMDFRHIGHKAIHAVQALSTLDITGWHDPEPTLRSVAATLALHYAEVDHDPDSHWPRNQKLQLRLREDWQRGRRDSSAAVAIAETLRTATPEVACESVVDQINAGIHPGAVWDAVLLVSAELFANNPRGVEALHAVTTANAVYSAYLAAVEDTSKRLLLLQAVARVPDTRNYVAYWAQRRNQPSAHDLRLDRLGTSRNSPKRIEALFAGSEGLETRASIDRTRAFVAHDSARTNQVLSRAVELMSMRSDDCHDFKLAQAVREDLPRICAPWRPAFLAACSVGFPRAHENRNRLASTFEGMRS